MKDVVTQIKQEPIEQNKSCMERAGVEQQDTNRSNHCLCCGVFIPYSDAIGRNQEACQSCRWDFPVKG